MCTYLAKRNATYYFRFPIPRVSGLPLTASWKSCCPCGPRIATKPRL